MAIRLRIPDCRDIFPGRRGADVPREIAHVSQIPGFPELVKPYFRGNFLPMKLLGIHHIAIICSDYEISKRFYTDVLGFQILAETYRKERQSYKLDLSLNGQYLIELFSFPDPPKRVSLPEASGLRHLAFAVQDVTSAKAELEAKGICCEPIRTDKITGKRFTFFSDPDGLPLELYEK